ncbi:MAG TPA: OsmC family protein [Puia sp.]|nr:OsmC family protein [Puia sp.]
MDNTSRYEVNLHWGNGRKGLISSPVLDNSIEVATPPEFPKGIPGIWSPEHLLVAAVNSCLMTTFLAVAENSRLNFADFECTATGKLEKIDGKYLISEILLNPRLQITDESQREKALKVLQKSEAACLISNSIKSRIAFNPEVVVCETHSSNQ